MRNSKLLTALLCSLSLMVGTIAPVSVHADASSRVVTLGADLDQNQRNVMMNYFKVNPNEVQIIYVTNRDERAYLAGSIPLAQIGNRTVSCAYVKPTTSGGIKVRTANLNYVTCNMIASTLSTSGVKNCEVVAACPFEVSGTRALTGITMAYEKASGESLDPQKKETAVKEMVVTGNLSNSINNSNDAINIINTGKMEVIGNNIQNADEIQNVVINIAQQNNVDISEELLKQIVDLLKEIADQDYKYEDVEETLENVESNVNEEAREEKIENKEEESTEVDEESILNDLNTDALGDVFESSTEDPELEVQTAEAQQNEVNWGFIDPEVVAEENAQILEETGEDLYSEENEEGFEEEAAEEDLDLTLLTDEQKDKFERVEKFLKGELEGDLEAYQIEMGEDTYPVSVFMDQETTEKLTKDILKMYYDILKDGTDSFIPDEEDHYVSKELNMVCRGLKDILLLTEYIDTENYMYQVADMDRVALMDDLMKFFEKVYDESVAVETEENEETEETTEESWNEESYEETYEESYEESYEEESEEQW